VPTASSMHSRSYTHARLKPHLQCLDIKALTALKTFFTIEDIYQLALPYVHWHNMAEHVIHMFKNHFITRLCSTATDFPCIYGIACCCKQNSLAICFVAATATQNCQPGCTSMDPSTLITHPLPHLAHVCWPTSNLMRKVVGHNMAWRAGTLPLPGAPINATQFG